MLQKSVKSNTNIITLRLAQKVSEIDVYARWVDSCIRYETLRVVALFSGKMSSKHVVLKTQLLPLAERYSKVLLSQN